MRLKPRSLRIRLTLLFAMVMLAALGALGLLLDYSLSSQLREHVRLELAGKIALIRNLLASAARGEDLAGERARLSDALVGHPGLHVNILDRTGAPLIDLPAFPWPAPLVVAAARGDEVERTARLDGRRYRLVLAPVARGEGSERVVMALAYDMAEGDQILYRVRLTILLACLVGSVVAGALGYLAADRGLLPVRRLAQAAARIGAESLDVKAEDLKEHLDIEAVPLELRELAESFNAMLWRLAESFRRLSAFSSDLAHELRTPLSNLMLQAQVALDKPRSAQELRSALESGLEELYRLSRMVNDMLFLAKADHRQIVLRYERVALDGEARKVLDFFEGLAADSDIRLVYRGAAEAMADRGMMRRMLANLLSNAVRHAAKGSQVDVALGTDGRRASIAVINQGPALSAADCERIFDRFYRVEPARGSECAGLGLSIVKSIASLHGGTVQASSASGRTTFLVVLPGSLTLASADLAADASSLPG